MSSPTTFNDFCTRRSKRNSTESNILCRRCLKRNPSTEYSIHSNGTPYKICRRCLVRRALSSFPSSLTGSRRNIANNFLDILTDPEADRLAPPYIADKLIRMLLPKSLITIYLRFYTYRSQYHFLQYKRAPQKLLLLLIHS